MSATIKVYEYPIKSTLIHASVFPNSIGVIKLPGLVNEVSRTTREFGVVLVVDKSEKHTLVHVPLATMLSTVVEVSEVPRVELIRMLKTAIKNNEASVISYPYYIYDANPILHTVRQLDLDVLLHATIYLDELLQQESDDRARKVNVRKIEEAFMSSYYAPTHPICQRRLMREFHAFNQEIITGC
jgi:hypothetical protein